MNDDYARGLHGKLLAECEQRNTALRAENERLRVDLGYHSGAVAQATKMWSKANSEADELRAALQALVDATDPFHWRLEGIGQARAVAVAVLTPVEGEGGANAGAIIPAGGAATAPSRPESAVLTGRDDVR